MPISTANTYEGIVHCLNKLPYPEVIPLPEEFVGYRLAQFESSLLIMVKSDIACFANAFRFDLLPPETYIPIAEFIRLQIYQEHFGYNYFCNDSVNTSNNSHLGVYNELAFAARKLFGYSTEQSESYVEMNDPYVCTRSAHRKSFKPFYIYDSDFIRQWAHLVPSLALQSVKSY